MIFIQEHITTGRRGVRKMQRITITLDDELVDAIDRTVAACGYQNRSEALRDLARAGISQARENADDPRAAVAALAYVYDHRERDLAKRLMRSFHDRHDLTVASMHVHLDHFTGTGRNSRPLPPAA
jgi:CopG family nickel-responsive transcriptional regulator